jgi:hypothetical protein
VTISASKLSILQIAKILDKFLPSQLAIPVAKVYDEPVESNVKVKTPLQIAESLGLAILKKTGNG